MRHEQLNRMTTLSGLLHMGHYDEAIRYIQAQSEHAQELLDFISSHFTRRRCAACCWAKPPAREKGLS
jgi:two-component system cit operon sensor histidine kinase CitA